MNTQSSIPNKGDVFEFDYPYDEKNTVIKFVVTDISEDHVWYKFINDEDTQENFYAWSHGMLKEIWLENSDNRRFLYNTGDLNYLHCIKNPYWSKEEI